MNNSFILRRRKLGYGSAARMTAATTQGIRALRNWVPSDIPEDTGEGGYVFRWGCTTNLPEQLRGKQVINKADAIHWCSDKKRGRLEMQAAGVPVPYTWSSWMEVRGDFDKVVFRPARHAQGRNLYVLGQDDFLMANMQCLNNLLHNFPDYYISQLIDKVAEYRVCVVSNRVVWVAKKTPGNPEEVAWNVARGGRFDNVRWGEWDPAVIAASLAAAGVSGTDFCGVDVMVDREGRPYVLEVNSAPSMTSDYRAGCLVKAFDYIVANGRDRFPEPTNYSWKKVIHPAVWESSRGRD